MSNTLLVISKSVPPKVCGMSDYTYNVALALSKFRKVEIGVNELPSNYQNNGIPVKKWELLIIEKMANKEPCDIFLSYTPTSYSRLCIPIDLIRTLKKFKDQNHENKLFIHFHELWSGSTNLRPHHAVLDWLTKWTVGQLVILADEIAVFTQGQREKLEERYNVSNIEFISIGSSILPIDMNKGLETNRNAGEWLVFGLAHTRLWTLQKNLPFIKKAYEKGLLNSIIAIGPANNKYARMEAQLIAEHLKPGVLMQVGALKPNEVSNHLLNAEAALLGQSVENLDKSSSFAALAAHAIPIISNISPSLISPPGDAFFTPDEIINNPEIFGNDICKKRQLKINSWFIKTCSWDTISLSIINWMEVNNY